MSSGKCTELRGEIKDFCLDILQILVNKHNGHNKESIFEQYQMFLNVSKFGGVSGKLVDLRKFNNNLSPHIIIMNGKIIMTIVNYYLIQIHVQP